VKGRDHVLSAAMAGVAVGPLLPEGGMYLAVASVLIGGIGAVNDIDSGASTVSRSFGFLTGTLALLVHLAGVHHRKLTHSILGVGLFSFGALEAGRFQASGPARGGHPALSWHLAPAGALLAILFASALRIIDHKPRHGKKYGRGKVVFHPAGHWYDLAGIALAGMTLWTGWDLGLVTPWHVQALAVCMALGMSVHIAGDMCTHDGCPLLYPFIQHDFGLPKDLRITTAGLAENKIVFPALLVGIGFFAWRDTGVFHFATHLHAARSHP
jgi:membrane-bound metal-dependent hydrolase YbcI (DUF457 family)